MSRKINQFILVLLVFGFVGCSAPLTELSRRGDAGGVQRALERGRDVNARTPQGHSPLTLASREGHLDVVLDLLRAGADVHAVAWTDRAPIRVRKRRIDIRRSTRSSRERYREPRQFRPTVQVYGGAYARFDAGWVLRGREDGVDAGCREPVIEDVVEALVDGGADVLFATSGGEIVDACRNAFVQE